MERDEPYFGFLVGRRDLPFSGDLLAGAFVWDPPDDRVAVALAMWSCSRSAKSGDRSSSVGPFFAIKPPAGVRSPTATVIARAYLEDNLRETGSLHVVIAVQWALP